MSNKKCIGCGNYLSSDKNSISYVKDDSMKYCVRCFQMKNYGKLMHNAVENDITQRLKNLNFEDNLIIMILDLFDLENSILTNINSDNILIVVNKLSCLPLKFKTDITLNNINNILKEKDIYPIDIILYDSIEKKNLRKIMNHIEYYTKRKKKSFFIGRTNVGKSSLINSLLKINKEDSNIICSPIKNTTLDLIKIKIGRNQLIDTPGFINDYSILDKIDNNEIIKISKSKFNSNLFSIKNKNQLYFIEKLFGIVINDFDEINKPSIIFYKNSHLKINRMKIEKMESFLSRKENIEYLNNLKFIEEKIVLDENKKYSIFAAGASLIVIKGIKNISIFCPEEIHFSITNNSII